MHFTAEKTIKPKLILMDVYETLLDMSEVEKRANRLLDSKRGYTVWFDLFMQYLFVDNCTLRFNDFLSIGKATMQMTAKTLGRRIEDSSIDELLDLLKYVPVHDGVQEGLSQLHKQGFRIGALTNSPQETVLDRMERTGLISYFEMVLCAEQVKKYKPCLEVYEWAAQMLKIDTPDILLVSCHGWDIAGGSNAGMRTAYMMQDRQMLYPLAPEPDIICTSLEDLASQLQQE